MTIDNVHIYFALGTCVVIEFADRLWTNQGFERTGMTCALGHQ